MVKYVSLCHTLNLTPREAEKQFIILDFAKPHPSFQRLGAVELF